MIEAERSHSHRMHAFSHRTHALLPEVRLELRRIWPTDLLAGGGRSGSAPVRLVTMAPVSKEVKEGSFSRSLRSKALDFSWGG